jgi:serine/threonine protein kinase
MTIPAYKVNGTFEFFDAKTSKEKRIVLMEGTVTKVIQNKIGLGNSVIVLMKLSKRIEGVPENVLVKIHDQRIFGNITGNAAIRRARAHYEAESKAYAHITKTPALKPHAPTYYGGYGCRVAKSSGGHYAVMMEYCDAKSAKEFVKGPHKAAFEAEVVRLVDLFHSNGLAHGDLAKPDNYLVQLDGGTTIKLKICDYNCAVVKPGADAKDGETEGLFETTRQGDDVDTVQLFE